MSSDPTIGDGSTLLEHLFSTSCQAKVGGSCEFDSLLQMSNGVSREESGTSGTADETIQAILDKVRVQGIAQEERAKAQRSNTGGKTYVGLKIFLAYRHLIYLMPKTSFKQFSLFEINIIYC